MVYMPAYKQGMPRIYTSQRFPCVLGHTFKLNKKHNIVVRSGLALEKLGKMISLIGREWWKKMMENCKSGPTFRSCFFNFQFSQASLLHSLWLLPFSICPWGGRSYGPCRLRRKGCYSPVTLTRSASSPALIYGHRGRVEVSWCTIGFQRCHPHPDAQTHTTFTTPSPTL